MNYTSRKTARNRFAVGMALLALFSGAGAVGAANWYVDGGASGSNDGMSWENAWKDLSDINWSAVQPGDTLYISGGSSGRTYNGGLVVGKSGTAANPIVIRCGQDEGHTGKVTINGQVNFRANTHVHITGELNGARNIRVTNPTGVGMYATVPLGLKILHLEVFKCGDQVGEHAIQFNSTLANAPMGTEVAYNHIQTTFQDGINANQGRAESFGEWSIHHNIIEDIGDDGIQVNGGVDVYNNIVRDGRKRDPKCHPDGMQFVKNHVRVYNNVIQDYSNSLLFLTSVGNRGGHWHVYNNVMSMRHMKPTFTRAIELQAINSYKGGYVPNVQLDDILIDNNTILDHVDYYALNLWKRDNQVGTVKVSNMKVRNNIFHNIYSARPTGKPVILPDWGSEQDIVFEANIISGANTKIQYRGVTYANLEEFNARTSFTRNSSATPNFVDAKGGDYRTAAGCGASIDRGVAVAGFSFDHNGAARPQGAEWDIGAFESGGGGSAGGSSAPAPGSPGNLRIVN